MNGIRLRAGALIAILAVCGAAQAAEVHVMISVGFSAAYRALAPQFERSTGHTLKTISGPSMGNTPDAKEPQAGRALIRFLTSAAAAAEIEKSGLEPANLVQRRETSPSPY